MKYEGTKPLNTFFKDFEGAVKPYKNSGGKLDELETVIVSERCNSLGYKNSDADIYI